MEKHSTSFGRLTGLTLIVVVVFFLSTSSLSAWTGPTSNPPSGNVPAPLNVGTANQTKTGGLLTLFNLWVNAALGVTGGATFGGNVGIGNISPTQKLDVTGYVKGTGLCIGADCRTSWPTGGTGFTGSGTANYLTKFTGASALGNSSIFDNGNVGIGNTSPTQKLDVTGYVKGTGVCIGSNCRTSWPVAKPGYSEYQECSFRSANTGVAQTCTKTTSNNHDLCVLSSVQGWAQGFWGGCQVSGTPGGKWTVAAHSVWARQIVCGISCYDFK